MEEFIKNYIQKQLTEIPATLNRKISLFDKKFNHRNDFNILKMRIDLFLEQKSDERFFVLPGLRGVGKTTLLLQCYEYLLKQKDIDQINLLYLSCDDLKVINATDLNNIIEIYLKEVHNTTPLLLDKPVFIFIDEAHYDKNWDLHAKLLFDKSPYIFMMFSGSSSLYLDYHADAARRLKIHEIMPLNYSQHLKLKYDYETNLSNYLVELLFQNNIDKAISEEKKIQNDLINIPNYTMNEWDTYFKYGGFCTTLNKVFLNDIISELWDIISKIVDEDISPKYNLNKDNEEEIYRSLVLIASQKPGEISQNKVAGSLSKSTSTINNIFNILEKTKVLFHIQSYGSAGKRSKKSWKYYITTPSLKNGINKKFGHNISSQREYDGILLENLVASSLFNLRNNLIYNPDLNFDFSYDSSSGGVDFIIQREFHKPVPIEVGLGKKNDKQVRKFMNKHDSDYGIIVSNKTSNIEREDNIINIPPRTFSFL